MPRPVINPVTLMHYEMENITMTFLIWVTLYMIRGVASWNSGENENIVHKKVFSEN